MAKVSVYNIDGKEVGSIELNDAVFGVEVNEHLVHLAVVNQLANKRQGTQSAKTRSEVSGGGRKPWRQKGTGHARQGSIRAAQWTGGGVVFAPTPRDYDVKMNKKERVLALKSALTHIAKNKSLVVVDSLELKSNKTSEVKELIKTLGLNGKVLFITANDGENRYLATRNLGYTYSLMSDEINCYDLVNADTVVIEEEAVKKIEEALK